MLRGIKFFWLRQEESGAVGGLGPKASSSSVSDCRVCKPFVDHPPKRKMLKRMSPEAYAREKRAREKQLAQERGAQGAVV